MTEIKIANYTLMAVLLLIMATFSLSMNSIYENSRYEARPAIFAGFIN